MIYKICPKLNGKVVVTLMVIRALIENIARYFLIVPDLQSLRLAIVAASF